MKNTILALAALLITTTHCFAMDVVSNGTKFVKVTKINKFRKFELCDTSTKKCNLLGERLYGLSELQDLHTRLAWQTAGSSVVAVVGIACAGTGVLAGVTAIAEAGLADLAGTALGVTFLGGSIGGSVLAITSKYNPVSIYQRMDSVNSEVIQDETVSLDGGNAEIEEFAENLNETLKDI